MPPVPLPVDEWVDLHWGQGTGHPLIDDDLDLATPTYTAVTGVEADFIEAHDDLTVLLGELADVSNDLAVWHENGTLAAIVRSGRTTVFEQSSPDARPPSRKGKPVPQLFGRAVTAIVIWMGDAGWQFSEAHGVLLRLKVQIANHHIGRLIRAGRSGKLRAIRLEEAYVRQLEGLRSLVLAGAS
jgi:hypothetical protein